MSRLLCILTVTLSIAMIHLVDNAGQCHFLFRDYNTMLVRTLRAWLQRRSILNKVIIPSR